MKLITQNGELDLPKDFSLTMERTNPLLSGEGDASVPATLPSSSRNLAALGHRERIDRAERYTNKVDAILQVGPVQKRGQLVIDTMHRHNGIDTSFAIDSSDLYVKAKGKSLKDIIDMGRGGQGIKIPFADIESARQYMTSIYNGNMPNADFVVFPVAVSPYDDDRDASDIYHYQLNNEPDGQGGLRCEERIVREGDVSMAVPEGYGIAPFLKLQRMIDVLFKCLGYTVTGNCFDKTPYSQIAIVHNCSDCLVHHLLDYKDLVPSCTLSEFLEWLLAKFHAQPVVDSENREVRIVKMEDMMASAADIDLGGLVVGDWTVRHNPSRRVVLSPTLTIEATEAAAGSFDLLLKKYNGYVLCDELQWMTLESDTPAVNDSLVQRKATGEFYLLERNLGDGRQVTHRLGTNYFAYDRDNSDETESFSQADAVPLMLCGQKREVVPYIGSRIHRHTSYNGETEEDEQKIIAVQWHTSPHFVHRTTATTQKTIPYGGNGAQCHSFAFGLDNHSLYGHFWQRYNTLLLNHPVHVEGKLRLGLAQFLGMDMSRLKLCDGQRLIPVRASAATGGRTGITDAEFILEKEYADGVADTQPSPTPINGLKWEMVSQSDSALAQELWNDYLSWVGQLEFHVNWFHLLSVEIAHNGFDGPVWLGQPSSEGQAKTIQCLVAIAFKVEKVYLYNGAGSLYKPYTIDHTGIHDEAGNAPETVYDISGRIINDPFVSYQNLCPELRKYRIYKFKAVRV